MENETAEARGTRRPSPRRERGIGYIFKPKYKTKCGAIRESRFFYIQYYRNGVRYVENTHTDKKTPAQSLLNRRLGSDDFVAPKFERIRFDELAADLVADYEKNGKRSLPRLRRSVRYLTKYFRGERAVNIDGGKISKYAILRKQTSTEDGAVGGLSTAAENATVNRELAALRRMFYLGKEQNKVRFIPTIKLLNEDNIRKGFLEHEQYRQLRSALPGYASAVLVAMYYTGMRIGEVLAIQWSQVDITEREIRLEPGTTKNAKGRTLPLDGELFEMIRMQRQERDSNHPSCPWVFSNGGRPIKNLYKAWRTACVKVGLGQLVCVSCSNQMGEAGVCSQCSGRATKYVGLIPHDLRRTGVRNLVRAGVPRSVAMKISGHETESVFERYDITSQRDLREAAESLTRYIGSKNSQSLTKVPEIKSAPETPASANLLN